LIRHNELQYYYYINSTMQTNCKTIISKSKGYTSSLLTLWAVKGMSWDALGASQPSPESNSWFLSLFFSLLLLRSFNQQHQVGSAAKKGLVISDSYHHVGVPKAKAMKKNMKSCNLNVACIQNQFEMKHQSMQCNVVVLWCLAEHHNVWFRSSVHLLIKALVVRVPVLLQNNAD